MQAFDIRITGEADDHAPHARVHELIGRLLASGGRVHHASLNGQEIRAAQRGDAPEIQTTSVDAILPFVGAPES